MKTGALVLAAGKASRFGSPKQLLEMGGITLLDGACMAARDAGCDPVLRVLGSRAELILGRPCPQGVATLVHRGWEEGMGASLAAGMLELQAMRPDLDAVLVLLSDQPMVGSAPFAEMFGRLRQPGISIVLCDHGEACGPPALFSAEHFSELQSLSGDQGAKAITRNHGNAVSKVHFPEGIWDIDSPEAWERFNREMAASWAKRSG